MKKITLLFTFCLALATINAQDINFDVSSTVGSGWVGFMNVSNLPAGPCGGDGVYQFGSGWGTDDLVTVKDLGANTVTLKPNRIGDTDPYWQTPGELEGEKVMAADFYLEDDSLALQSFTFNGSVVSTTINSAGLCLPYTASAFIKIFDAGYALLNSVTIALPASGDFTVVYTYTVADMNAVHIQYGFNLTGVNINSDVSFDAAYDALGSIVITENAVLSIDDAELSQTKVFPNPTQNMWTVQSIQEITSIEVYDVLGKQVIAIDPSSSDITIDGTNLSNGLYIAKINSPQGSTVKRLVKE